MDEFVIWLSIILFFGVINALNILWIQMARSRHAAINAPPAYRRAGNGGRGAGDEDGGGGCHFVSVRVIDQSDY